MNNKNRVVAMVPIKLHNERLPGKNTKLLGDKPLINYILDTLNSIDEIDETYVYCSDDKICEYLSGKIEFLKRPQELDLPLSNFTQIFECFSEEIYADTYVFAHATAPFLQKSSIEECVKMVTTQDFDSAFTATKIQSFLWKDGKPLNFDATNLPRTQDLKPIYQETSGVYVFERNVFTEKRRRIGDKPFIKEVSFQEAIDIDEAEDFMLAEMFLNRERMQNG